MDHHNSIPSVPPSESMGERSKDYPALCVFVGLVIALLVTGIFAVRNIDTDFRFRPDQYLQEWTRILKKKAKMLLGETSKGLKMPGRESTDAKTHLLKGYRLHRQNSYNEALQS